MERLEEIQRRLDLLEAGLAELRTLVQAQQTSAPNPAAPSQPSLPNPSPGWTAPAFWTGSRPPTPAPPTPPVPRPPTPPLTSVSPSPTSAPSSFGSAVGSPRSGEFEANMLSSWFARAGAIAIFLGAAFAFKYAVDRDLISPAGRVAIGLLVGLAFVGWGEWAHRKTWPLFAQAVAGGGVAICYLSVWAGYQLYDLMAPFAALVLLALVVVGGGALAIRQDSLPLAVIASLGGFLNPVLVSTGRGSGISLYTYLLLLDLGILGLAIFRSWRPLTAVALFSTWFLVFAGTVSLPAPQSNDLVGLGFATLYLLLFHAVCLRAKITGAGPSGEPDRALVGANAVAYFFFGLVALPAGAHSSFALVVGLAHIGAGLWLRQRPDPEQRMVQMLIGLGVSAVTIAAGQQFDGPVLSTVWALEAMALAAAGTQRELSKLNFSAFAVFTLSVLTSLGEYQLGFAYDPELPLLSIESLPFVVQIIALGGGGVLLRKRDDEIRNGRYADLAAIAANSMALIWFSFELWAIYERSTGWSLEGFTFALSSIWTLYASILLAFGISMRAKWARLMAVGLFLFVIAKLVVADLWLLETPMRIAAFMGLGLVLLLCSVGYHRFRALILGPDELGSPALTP